MKKSLVLFFMMIAVLPAMGQTTPRHLAEAEELLTGLSLANTNYEHGTPQVTWNKPKACHTDCSGFMDALLMRSYHYDRDGLKRWFDSGRPSARRYYEAIEAQHGFKLLEHVAELRPGDILAVKYFTRTDNTGHVMLAASAAKPYPATEPLVDGTQQWQVEVIDSSESGHGMTDTRHKKGLNGKDHDGLGRGVLRIYAFDDGTVAGMSWSTLKVSEFKKPETERLLMGRLTPGFVP